MTSRRIFFGQGMKRGILVASLLWIGFGAGTAAGATESPAQIYTGGDILTMNHSRPLAEAVAVRDGRIVAVGSLAEVEKAAGEGAERVDLQGRTLLPGFIDSHSHVSLTGMKLALANMSNVPAGPIASIEDIKREFRRWKDEKKIGPGELLAGWGYDHTQLAEKRHPTRDDLDEISTENPIVLIHFSGHQAVLNSKALEIVGYDETTPDPEGGRILRRPGTNVPNGIVQETAWIPIKLEIFKGTYEEKKERVEKALELYEAHGFTTAQDAAIVDQETIDIYRELGRAGTLEIDVAGMPFYRFADQMLGKGGPEKAYRDHFRLAGVKLVLDGGSPGRSAYLREPYHVQEPGEKDFRGVAFFTDQSKIDEMVTSYYARGWPTFIHALGDAAVDQALHAIGAAERAHPGRDRRTQLIHAQLFHPDQMEMAKKLGATVTFQTAHVYYFGDFHRETTFGPERAEHLCPAKSALERGLSVSIHHDSPIHPPDQIMLIWIAVNRRTRSGRILGPAERLSVQEALEASTLNAAYQLFEEDRKGSIEPGKLADFVLLSENPLEVDPMKLKDIEVLKTIKEGRVVYEKPAAAKTGH